MFECILDDSRSVFTTELELTEQKTTGHISSSSQSSIAALKDVLAYGRLTSSPPLPPPFTLWRTTDHPYTISLYLLGRSVGEARGCGGGGKGAELVNLPFPRKFWRTLRAKADCTHIVLP